MRRLILAGGGLRLYREWNVKSLKWWRIKSRLGRLGNRANE